MRNCNTMAMWELSSQVMPKVSAEFDYRLSSRWSSTFETYLCSQDSGLHLCSKEPVRCFSNRFIDSSILWHIHTAPISKLTNKGCSQGTCVRPQCLDDIWTHTNDTKGSLMSWWLMRYFTLEPSPAFAKNYNYGSLFCLFDAQAHQFPRIISKNICYLWSHIGYDHS